MQQEACLCKICGMVLSVNIEIGGVGGALTKPQENVNRLFAPHTGMIFFCVRCPQNKRGFAKHTTSFSWTPSPHHNVEQRRSTKRLATNPRLFCSTLHSLISVLLSTLWWGDGGCAMMRILKPTFILQTPVP